MEDVTVVETVNQYGVEHVQKIIANDAAPHDWFGVSISLSADKSILTVGAYGVNDSGSATGSVYIYKRDAGADTYNTAHIQKLTASDGAAGDQFGFSAALSSDKNILVVGASGDDDGGADTGSVYIYQKNVGLDTYNPEHVQKLTASDGATSDNFGASVAISSDKSILIVGARGDNDGGANAGSVYIYEQDAGADTYNTAHIQKLTASDRAAGDQFGFSVSLSADKSILAVGAIWDDDDGIDSGSVYIYKQDAGLDTYNPAHIQKLNASDGASRDWFGTSVSISADKSILVVGVHGDDDGGADTGSVYIYQQNVGLDTYNPEHVQKLTASDKAIHNYFGASVSLSADKSILAVGSIRDDDGGANAGSVHVYQQLSVTDGN